VEVSRTIISKFILITGLFAACIANAQTPTPTPAALSLQGSPSGLSAYDGGTPASGTTQATTPTIFGGYTGPNNGCSGSPASTSTCDSCTGGTTLATCNPTSIHPTLLLSITLLPVASSLTGASPPRVRWKFSSSASVYPIANTPSLAAGQPFTAQIAWATLCAAAGGDGTCTTDITSSQSFSIWIDTDNNDATIEEKVDFNFVFRYVTGADRLSGSCPAGGPNNSVATEGICDYTVYRGDQKVYILEYAAGSNELTTDNAAVKYNRIAMFYVKNAGIATITTNSPKLILNLTNNAPSAPEITDQRITSLENDVKYCFALGNMDQTGNITRFPVQFELENAANDAKFCATPSQVVGLLDDKHCFIATATYGSTMASEVQTFRNFRNKFLLNSSFGKSFVNFYYTWGPEAAEWISHNAFLKTLSLWALWPMLLFVKLCLAWGLLPASFVALATVILLKKSVSVLWQRRSQMKGAV